MLKHLRAFWHHIQESRRYERLLRELEGINAADVERHAGADASQAARQLFGGRR